MFGQVITDQVELSFGVEKATDTFPMRDIFSIAACHIARGGTLQVLGQNKTGFYETLSYQPNVDTNGITGAIIYIDSFGNLITNISLALFKQIVQGKNFDIKIRGNSYGINHICSQYNDVDNGNALAIFTSEGYLQIAINHGAAGTGGGAAQLFGLQLFGSVRLDFEKTVENLSDF